MKHWSKIRPNPGPRALAAALGIAFLAAAPALAQPPRIGGYTSRDPNAVVRPVDPALKDWYQRRGVPSLRAGKPGSAVYRSRTPRNVIGPSPHPFPRKPTE